MGYTYTLLFMLMFQIHVLESLDTQVRDLLLNIKISSIAQQVSSNYD